MIKKKGKKYFFKKTDSIYKKIKKIGHFIVKKWPDYRNNSMIYYTLAVMTMERSDPDEIKKVVGGYLTKGLENSEKGSIIYKKLIVKAADHFYEIKDYRRSSRFYQVVICLKKDKWYTRYLFNLAWSMMGIDQKNKARKYAQKALFLSLTSKDDDRYVDYSNNVIQYMSSFIDEYNLEDSLKIFRPSFEHFTIDQFESIAESSKEIGKYGIADYFFGKAMDLSDEKDQGSFFERSMKRLDFYFEIKQHQKIKKTTRYLANTGKFKAFDKKQKKILIGKIKKYIRSLQEKKNKINLSNILYNLDTLKIIDKKNKHLYLFFQGESFFLNKKFVKSLEYYKKSLEMIKLKKKINKKRIKMVFDSMLKALEKSKLTSLKKNNWNIYIYKNHLSIFPVEPRSKVIYQKLFNLYYKKKQYKKYENIFLMYSKYYSKKASVQMKISKSKNSCSQKL